MLLEQWIGFAETGRLPSTGPHAMRPFRGGAARGDAAGSTEQRPGAYYHNLVYDDRVEVVADWRTVPCAAWEAAGIGKSWWWIN